MLLMGDSTRRTVQTFFHCHYSKAQESSSLGNGQKACLTLAAHAVRMLCTEARKAQTALVNHGNLPCAQKRKKSLDEAIGAEQKLSSILLMKSG